MLQSCSEEQTEPRLDESEVNPIVESLTAHSWRFFSEFYRLSNGQYVGYFIPQCVLDDSLRYYKNGEYTRHKGNQPCPVETEEPFSVQWELVNDSTLTTTNNSIVTEKKILILNSDTLFLQSLTLANDTVAYLYLRY